MKIDSLIYLVDAITVIVGVAMKILHLPYANLVLNIGLVGVALFMIVRRGTTERKN